MIEPAIALAENGFVISDHEASSLKCPASGSEAIQYGVACVLREKTQWKKGDTLIQKDLGKHTKKNTGQGEAGFYEGETARLIVEEMKRGKWYHLR
jgi:gamma-glutamyltranspeptidase/glutathione hydrolase